MNKPGGWLRKEAQEGKKPGWMTVYRSQLSVTLNEGPGEVNSNNRRADYRALDTEDVSNQITAATPIVNSRPFTESRVSLVDQVFIVSATLMLKYALTSQNPPSLTWEKMSAPAPVAMASNSGRTPGLCKRIGATMPAAVVMATVEDPVAKRMSAAISHPNKRSDTWACSATPTMACETPLS